MATLSHIQGRAIIQFPLDADRRATIRLGKMDRKAANAIRTHIERLVVAKETGQPVPMETASWLAGVGPTLHAKIFKYSLVSNRPGETVLPIGKLVDAYIARRTDLKSRSIANLKQCRRSLVGHFGDKYDARRLTRADAADWARKLKTTLAPATISMHIKRARQIFTEAVDRNLISANPFTKLKAGSQVNASRNQYVPASDALKVIDVCPDAEWRLIFALARFGGLRTPSETRLMKWSDVDWARGRMIVHSPKTEHHIGKAEREVPIFADLLPWLRDAFELAEDGTEYLIQKHRGENLRTMAEKIIARAGLKRWPRLFQNLRASCETDLASRFPLHVACVWIGNSQMVAARHYLQVTDDLFAAATQRAAECAAISTAHGAKYMQANGGIGVISPYPGNPVPPRGVELSTISPAIQQIVHEAVQNALHSKAGHPSEPHFIRRLIQRAKRLHRQPRIIPAFAPGHAADAMVAAGYSPAARPAVEVAQ